MGRHDWVTYDDPDVGVYYYHRVTGESCWELPEELASARAAPAISEEPRAGAAGSSPRRTSAAREGELERQSLRSLSRNSKLSPFKRSALQAVERLELDPALPAWHVSDSLIVEARNHSLERFLHGPNGEFRHHPANEPDAARRVSLRLHWNANNLTPQAEVAKPMDDSDLSVINTYGLDVDSWLKHRVAAWEHKQTELADPDDDELLGELDPYDTGEWYAFEDPVSGLYFHNVRTGMSTYEEPEEVWHHKLKRLELLTPKVEGGWTLREDERAIRRRIFAFRKEWERQQKSLEQPSADMIVEDTVVDLVHQVEKRSSREARLRQRAERRAAEKEYHPVFQGRRLIKLPWGANKDAFKTIAVRPDCFPAIIAAEPTYLLRFVDARPITDYPPLRHCLITRGGHVISSTVTRGQSALPSVPSASRHHVWRGLLNVAKQSTLQKFRLATLANFSANGNTSQEASQETDARTTAVVLRTSVPLPKIKVNLDSGVVSERPTAVQLSRRRPMKMGIRTHWVALELACRVPRAFERRKVMVDDKGRRLPAGAQPLLPEAKWTEKIVLDTSWRVQWETRLLEDIAYAANVSLSQLRLVEIRRQKGPPMEVVHQESPWGAVVGKTNQIVSSATDLWARRSTIYSSSKQHFNRTVRDLVDSASRQLGHRGVEVEQNLPWEQKAAAMRKLAVPDKLRHLREELPRRRRERIDVPRDDDSSTIVIVEVLPRALDATNIVASLVEQASQPNSRLRGGILTHAVVGVSESQVGGRRVFADPAAYWVHMLHPCYFGYRARNAPTSQERPPRAERTPTADELIVSGKATISELIIAFYSAQKRLATALDDGVRAGYDGVFRLSTLQYSAMRRRDDVAFALRSKLVKLRDHEASEAMRSLNANVATAVANAHETLFSEAKRRRHKCRVERQGSLRRRQATTRQQERRALRLTQRKEERLKRRLAVWLRNKLLSFTPYRQEVEKAMNLEEQQQRISEQEYFSGSVTVEEMHKYNQQRSQRLQDTVQLVEQMRQLFRGVANVQTTVVSRGRSLVKKKAIVAELKHKDVVVDHPILRPLVLDPHFVQAFLLLPVEVSTCISEEEFVRFGVIMQSFALKFLRARKKVQEEHERASERAKRRAVEDRQREERKRALMEEKEQKKQKRQVKQQKLSPWKATLIDRYDGPEAHAHFHHHILVRPPREKRQAGQPTQTTAYVEAPSLYCCECRRRQFFAHRQAMLQAERALRRRIRGEVQDRVRMFLARKAVDVSKLYRRGGKGWGQREVDAVSDCLDNVIRVVENVANIEKEAAVVISNVASALVGADATSTNPREEYVFESSLDLFSAQLAIQDALRWNRSEDDHSSTSWRDALDGSTRSANVPSSLPSISDESSADASTSKEATNTDTAVSDSHDGSVGSANTRESRVWRKVSSRISAVGVVERMKNEASEQIASEVRQWKAWKTYELEREEMERRGLFREEIQQRTVQEGIRRDRESHLREEQERGFRWFDSFVASLVHPHQNVKRLAWNRALETAGTGRRFLCQDGGRLLEVVIIPIVYEQDSRHALTEGTELQLLREQELVTVRFVVEHQVRGFSFTGGEVTDWTALIVIVDHHPEGSLVDFCDKLRSFDAPRTRGVHGRRWRLRAKNQLALGVVADENVLQLKDALMVGWCHSVAKGLATLHRAGIVHRNLHPGAVQVDEHGNARIGDYGCFRVPRKAADPYSFGRVDIHTAVHTPPELDVDETWRDSSTLSGAADIWAFGCCVFRWATGIDVPDNLPERYANGGEGSVRESLIAQVPSRFGSQIRNTIRQCLQSNPTHRASAEQLQKVLSTSCRKRRRMVANDTGGNLHG